MTLRKEQSRLVKMLGLLIAYADMLDYELTLGDAYRDPRAFGEQGSNSQYVYGRNVSAHKQRLAIDLNLFIDGTYQTSTEAHAPLGLFWESLGGTWGGSRSNADGNHYSIEYYGIK